MTIFKHSPRATWIKYFSWIGVLALLTGCGGAGSLSDSNLSEIYRKSNQLIEPDFSVYHTSTSETEVNFRINTANLLYAKKGAAGEYVGNIKVAYLLYKDFESNELVDSASSVIRDVAQSDNVKNLYGTFQLKIGFPNRYILKVETTDLNRNLSSINILSIDKSSYLGRQNFQQYDAKTGLLRFDNYMRSDDTVNIRFNNLKPTDKLTVRYYKRVFEVAPPPFSVYNPKPFDYKADHIFELALDDSSTASFHSIGNGFYHFQSDTTQREGFTLYHFNDDFPEINTVPEMTSALRFVTSRKEFSEIEKSDDPKKALDGFWLNIAQNPARARELIRTYYNRVQNANLYFSSFKEGWKTDRGIIYMVFGPPNVVYKSSTAESWIYREESNYLSVTFNFNKVRNPFSNNDYQLNRTPVYKNQWYRAVDAWRQGRISTLDY